MTTLKQAIHQKCVSIVHQRISMHQQAINDAQDAANQEQRSTAGDKYDTSRTMSQNERDMFARQLVASLQMKKILTSIDASTSTTKIGSGSLVKTSMGKYYLSVSCGELQHNGVIYIGISPLTPIGQAILGKVQGDSFQIRNVKNVILEVE